MAWLEEFKKFTQRGNAVDLAVALIIGAAFTSIVNSLVTDVFTPVLGIATRGGDAFSMMDIPLYQDASIKIGALLKAVINFFIISFCVFWLVKGLNALRLEKALADAPKTSELTTQEQLLAEIRDLLKGNVAPAGAAPPVEPIVNVADVPKPNP